ncbi:MAG: cob(I)yrinic acid a,c-diamide adenosyltransferase [Ignavibacteriales bacterium]|nr:cob(I)yrinic acid a,c-diamide adenosyltransferase [Ignavibacteriales bacterium]
MKLYTKAGDAGETALASGERTPKDAPRLRAYGAVDEANAHIGLAAAEAADARTRAILGETQHMLFAVGSDLATPLDAKVAFEPVRTPERFVEELERAIDEIEAENEPLREFVLPGGAKSAAQLHVARAVVRRAERETVALAREVDITPAIVILLNRLSDLLFALARYENRQAGVEDIPWRKPE